MKFETKNIIVLLIVTLVVVVLYNWNKKQETKKEESNWRLPRWIRIGLCNPCPDPTSRFCKNGCWKPNS
jgi:hypothetical protein